MRLPIEPEDQSPENYATRKSLASMWRMLTDSRSVDLLNESMQTLIGVAVFENPDYFKGLGCFVAYNSQEDELIVTVYHKTPDGDTWFRYFAVEYCGHHGFHLSEVIPPFVLFELTAPGIQTSAKIQSDPNHPSKRN